jgi:hypothetical protein
VERSEEKKEKRIKEKGLSEKLACPFEFYLLL